MGVVIKGAGPITVLQAVVTAGGLNPTAKLRGARITRKGENGRVEIPVDMSAMLSGETPDVTLQADDILFVPRSAAKTVRKLQEPYFYDVPTSHPLQDTTPIYIR